MSQNEVGQHEMQVTRRDAVLIDLALQGGGHTAPSPGGVLDRLLEEPWLQIAGISGTSAGAMNAAVLADGWWRVALRAPALLSTSTGVAYRGQPPSARYSTLRSIVS